MTGPAVVGTGVPWSAPARTGAEAAGLTGLGATVRLLLRRDRFALAVWVAVLGSLPVVVGAAGSDAGYPTAAEKQMFAATSANPAELAARGPVFAATTGGLTAWTVGGSVLLLTGLVSLLTTIRHTRVEEQSGRGELLGSAVLGRRAPLAAALVVVAGANAALAVLVATTLIAYGLPVGGSVALALLYLGGGVLFAAVGAVLAQVFDDAGAARGAGVAVIAACYVLVAVGELGRPGLVWASPFGWARRVQPFAGDRWWVLSLFGAAAVLLGVAAFALQARRDLGAGLVAARVGRSAAPDRLHSPLALAWRLHRGWIVGWAAGAAVLGALLGFAVTSVGPQLDTPAFRALTEQLGGGSPTEVFFRSVLYLLAQIVAAAVVAATLRLRAQERSGLADVVLVQPVSRARWAGGHLVLSAVGGIVVLAALGLGAGLASGSPAATLATTLAFAPACVVFAGIAAAAIGWLPRLATAVSWAALALAIGLDFLAEFRLAGPGITGISPFVSTPSPPRADLATLGALSALVAIAVVLGVLGVAGLRRRDLGTG